MKMRSTLAAGVLALGMFLGTSAASATSGVHWSPTFPAGLHSWTDHHGRSMNIWVNFFNSTVSSQTGGPTSSHGALALCFTLAGAPSHPVYGNIAYGSAWSVATCQAGYTNPAGGAAFDPF